MASRLTNEANGSRKYEKSVFFQSRQMLDFNQGSRTPQARITKPFFQWFESVPKKGIHLPNAQRVIWISLSKYLLLVAFEDEASEDNDDNVLFGAKASESFALHSLSSSLIVSRICVARYLITLTNFDGATSVSSGLFSVKSLYLLDGRNIRVQYAYGGRSPGPQVTTHQVLAVYRHYLDVLLTARMKGNFITAEDTSSEVTGLPSFTRMQAIPDSGWRPRGVLVAYLQEHGSAVNDIAISTDHSFFVSASEDCTVKVWDSRKLEKDISCRSRLTYSLEGSRAIFFPGLFFHEMVPKYYQYGMSRQMLDFNQGSRTPQAKITKPFFQWFESVPKKGIHLPNAQRVIWISLSKYLLLVAFEDEASEDNDDNVLFGAKASESFALHSLSSSLIVSSICVARLSVSKSCCRTLTISRVVNSVPSESIESLRPI
ncbi:hypothetical protein RJ640_004132 [Escallonia rubra]|uniref:Uncharacterized protein n=1 Tax=Escallonia rubra TaxID=112253 RepID=A0AA88ULZ2_9ASTE|nr:hypothetical protein RJ640_004132 [Escallonia rubra]